MSRFSTDTKAVVIVSLQNNVGRIFARYKVDKIKILSDFPLVKQIVLIAPHINPTT